MNEQFKPFLKRVYNINYGEGEIKTFSPQIKKALRILTRENYKSSTIHRKMRELGFKICKSSGLAFVGETQVIKFCYVFTADLKLPPKSYRVPTLVLSSKGYSHLMIQPRVVIPSIRERRRISNDISYLINGYLNTYDIHEWNVGKYLGKDVVFDW